MQDDPKMGQLYKDFIAMWNRESDGGLFNAFGLVSDNTQWGQWYLLHDINDTHGVKWAAVTTYLFSPTANPPVNSPAIPEPATIAMLGIATILTISRRNRAA